MPILEQILKRMGGRSRWIPHNFNPPDGLTKLKGPHMEPLLKMLKTGMFHLETEDAQLKKRAVEKEETGRKTRNKQSGKQSIDSHAEKNDGFLCAYEKDGGYCHPSMFFSLLTLDSI